MKEKIVNIIKLFLLVFIMIQGFFISYAFVWFAVGLPQENWALWLLYALAALSECGYIKWIKE